MDGDTGHGGVMAVRRMVRECIRAGIAGVRIDDQPIEGKRRTQSDGLQVVALEQAVARYRAAVDMRNELDPDFVVAHFALGNLLKELGDSPEAEVSYRAALCLKPGHAGALNNLGLLCLDSAQAEEGTVLLKQHARLEPSNRDAQNNLGLALTALGRFAEAEAAFERALQLDPHSAEVHGNLAGLWKESDRVGEAIAWVRG